MKKTVASMTIAKQVGECYTNILHTLFGDTLRVCSYSMEEGNCAHMDPADLYVITATSTPHELSFIPDGAQVVLSSVTFTRESVERLKREPYGTQAYLVNTSAEMALECITDLNRLGVKNIEFFPAYPGASDLPTLDLAVSVGEPVFVPACVSRVIETGHRIFNVNTITEIALRLDVSNILESHAFVQYMQSLSVIDFTLNDLLLRASNMENKFENLLGAMGEGIIGVDVNNQIFAFNRAAERILGVRSQQVLQKRTQEIAGLLPPECFDIQELVSDTMTRLIRSHGTDLSLTISPILKGGQYHGYYAAIQPFSDQERRQQQLRLQLLNKGHTSKYTFADIVGECPPILKAKEIARRVAATDAPVLLIGETGTGKELFAHAIHHDSLRKDMPFIAINCAALPDSLLESELFGYAEGAFTGARKRGKPGLFEYAHGGTLFLDEVEGMSANLQVKLLRVLQEKEVMRIGGDGIISVDVRIIAASNEDIQKMMETGAFRKDLYYRLNTLPIAIPPLRERGNDVSLIMESLKRKLGADFTLTADAETCLYSYQWNGNIRELRNLVEYLKCMNFRQVERSSLPAPLLQKVLQSSQAELGQLSLTEEFYTICGRKQDKARFFVKSLSHAGLQGFAPGRRQIASAAALQGISLTEQEIRTLATALEQHGFLQVAPGRRGLQLTGKGRELSACL